MTHRGRENHDAMRGMRRGRGRKSDRVGRFERTVDHDGMPRSLRQQRARHRQVRDGAGLRAPALQAAGD